MELHRDGEVALLRIQAGKANAINSAFLEKLAAITSNLGDARALVITGHGGFFSAGLDLPALLELDRPGMQTFIESFAAGMQRIFELPLPVVAAVNGHAIAGGCVLALQADYRIITDANCRIGLNEAQLGIGLPPVVVETLRCQVPATSLMPIALEGRLFEPADALRMHLVHEVVPAPQVEARAVAKARQLAAIAPHSYQQIKQALRRPALEALQRANSERDDRWVTTWFSAGGQERIRAAVANLLKKKS